MEFRTIGSNVCELELRDGTRVLFSYRKPVAAYIIGRGYIRTAERFSNTTSKHITQWLNGAKAETVPQSDIFAITEDI